MEAGQQSIGERAGHELLLAARGGDGEAFGVLIDPLLEPAYRLAVVLLRNHDQAEDVVQEATFSAWRSLRGFRGSPEQLKPWLMKIVANECRDVLRSPWWSVVRLSAPPHPSPEEHSLDMSDLAGALIRLNPNDRLALQLHYHLDLPVEKVAEVLGLTKNGAKARLRRALKRLRPHLVMQEDELP